MGVTGTVGVQKNKGWELEKDGIVKALGMQHDHKDCTDRDVRHRARGEKNLRPLTRLAKSSLQPTQGVWRQQDALQY